MNSLKYLLLIILSSRINLIVCHSKSDWNKLMTFFELFKEKNFSKDKDYIESIYKTANISEMCSKSISDTIMSLGNYEDWSYQMYDSWARFPPMGILEGTVTDFGDYDQCLSITPNQVIGESQYCLVDIEIPLPNPQPIHLNLNNKVEVLPKFVNRSGNHFLVKLSKNSIYFYLFSVRLGICTPNKCTKNELAVLAQNGIKNSGLILKGLECESKTGIKLNKIQTIALLVLLIFVFASVFATILEQISYFKQYPKYQRLLKTFSIKSNLTKLMSTKTSQELSCVEGMRTLTIIYIITAHVIELTDWSLYRDTFKFSEKLSAPQNIPITKVTYVVDTFFLISGLMASYTTLKYTEGKYENFNKKAFIIQRYIRLMPLMTIFLLLTTLLPIMSTGPVWKSIISTEVDKCYKYWWRNLLFIHNLMDYTNICVLPTWFLSLDMQYHWLSLIAIIALLKKTKFGFIVSSLFIFSSFFITSIIVFIYDFPAGRVSTGFGHYFHIIWPKMIYVMPWAHGSVYFIGLIFGYIVYKLRPKKLSNIKKMMIWISIAIGYFVNIYDTYYWTFGAPNNRWVSALLYPTTKLIWSLSTVTVIWMCITGNGGLVNKFLSWKAFTPLSRMTYSVYLTHVWIVWMNWGSKRELQNLSNFSISSLVSSTLLMSYLLGLIFTVIFESPVSYLQNSIKNKFLRSKPHEKEWKINSSDLTKKIEHFRFIIENSKHNQEM